MCKNFKFDIYTSSVKELCAAKETVRKADYYLSLPIALVNFNSKQLVNLVPKSLYLIFRTSS